MRSEKFTNLATEFSDNVKLFFISGSVGILGAYPGEGGRNDGFVCAYIVHRWWGLCGRRGTVGDVQCADDLVPR